MANYLTLNQNYVQDGLGTLTFIVPATILNGPAVSNVTFTVACQVTVPAAVPTGAGAGSGSGYGAGAGGGTLGGFAQGGGGTSAASTGQGFGPASSGYPQPLPFTSTPAGGAAVTSGLVITVKQNGTTVYTAPTLGQSQSALQFKTDLQCNAGDTITVNFTSGTASDEQLQGIQANVSIGNGQ